MELIEKVFDLIPNMNGIYFWTIIVLLILFISKINISSDNVKEKVLISYLILLFLEYMKLISVLFSISISFLFFFIFIELIFMSQDDKKLIKSGMYYLYDFLYKSIFIYKYHLFVLASLLLSNKIYNVLNNTYSLLGISIDLYYILGIIVIIIYLVIINGVLMNEFETISLGEIKKKMDDILSFDKYRHDKRLEDFSVLLTSYEDRSYFSRPQSFNWISLSFLKYKFNRVKSNRKSIVYNIPIIGRLLKNIITILISLYKFIKIILDNFISFIKMILNRVIKKLLNKKGRVSIRNYIRGYSTIEMQLIRTLALKNGYEKTIQRKIYEIVYSNLFFKSLLNHYNYYKYANIKEFKYYLLQIYIMVAPTFINGVKYSNIYELFKEREDILEITNEEFYIFCLGLANKKISEEIVNNKFPIKLDKKLLEYALEEVNDLKSMIPDRIGLIVRIMIYDRKIKKQFPITRCFDYSKTLEDINKYIEKEFCNKYTISRIDNIKEIIYGKKLTEEEIELFEVVLNNTTEIYKQIYPTLSLIELQNYFNFVNNYIKITCNVPDGGIGKAAGYEEGIKYDFHNNEKQIHNNKPHIHCKYGEEEIRIDLINLEVMDNKEFKSPVKTRTALAYVKEHQESLLNIWENVVDKDNIYNKKIITKIKND